MTTGAGSGNRREVTDFSGPRFVRRCFRARPPPRRPGRNAGHDIPANACVDCARSASLKPRGSDEFETIDEPTLQTLPHANECEDQCGRSFSGKRMLRPFARSQVVPSVDTKTSQPAMQANHVRNAQEIVKISCHIHENGRLLTESRIQGRSARCRLGRRPCLTNERRIRSSTR